MYYPEKISHIRTTPIQVRFALRSSSRFRFHLVLSACRWVRSLLPLDLPLSDLRSLTNSCVEMSALIEGTSSDDAPQEFGVAGMLLI